MIHITWTVFRVRPFIRASLINTTSWLFLFCILFDIFTYVNEETLTIINIDSNYEYLPYMFSDSYSS